MILTSLVRSGREKQYIEIKKCSQKDYILLASFAIGMLVFSLLGLHINRQEHALKEKVGKGLVASDIRYNSLTSLSKMALISVFSGLQAGALGLSVGAFVNPILIGLGLPPIVATSTGMYMQMYSTLASTVMFFTYGTLDLKFAAWFSFWGSVGILVSFSIIMSILRKYNRQSILVILVAVINAMSAILVPIQNYKRLKQQKEDGDEDLWKIGSFCD